MLEGDILVGNADGSDLSSCFAFKEGFVCLQALRLARQGVMDQVKVDIIFETGCNGPPSEILDFRRANVPD